MLTLQNTAQAYPWGSRTAIPDLLGVAPTDAAVAELWMGAHPSAPSFATTMDGIGMPLDAAVALGPDAMLGSEVVARFGPHLPYLLKLLAAEHPLSLQVHPGLERARAGYEAEEAAGVAATAPQRNYKDPNHKPELVLALTPFDALCGFRQPDEAAALLDGLDVPLARDLAAVLRSRAASDGVSAAVRALLHGELRPGVHEVAEVAEACRLRSSSASADPAADRTVVTLAEAYPGDPGVVMSLLLNRLTLAPGEAMFVPAGTVHAYQHGLAVELMASSDNVLRAGLTPKHIDVPELLAAIDYAPGPPRLVAPERVDPTTSVFRVPVDDFEMSVTELRDAVAHAVPGCGPRIVLCIEGTATLTTADGSVPLRPGRSVFVAAEDGPITATGPCRLVLADVPLGSTRLSPARSGR